MRLGPQDRHTGKRRGCPLDPPRPAPTTARPARIPTSSDVCSSTTPLRGASPAGPFVGGVRGVWRGPRRRKRAQPQRGTHRCPASSCGEVLMDVLFLAIGPPTSDGYSHGRIDPPPGPPSPPLLPLPPLPPEAPPSSPRTEGVARVTRRASRRPGAAELTAVVPSHPHRPLSRAAAGTPAGLSDASVHCSLCASSVAVSHLPQPRRQFFCWHLRPPSPPPAAYSTEDLRRAPPKTRLRAAAALAGRLLSSAAVHGAGDGGRVREVGWRATDSWRRTGWNEERGWGAQWLVKWEPVGGRKWGGRQVGRIPVNSE